MTAWTAERRAKMAAAIKERMPWAKSTGPKTPEGKQRSSRNGLKAAPQPEAPTPAIQTTPPEPEPVAIQSEDAELKAYRRFR